MKMELENLQKMSDEQIEIEIGYRVMRWTLKQGCWTTPNGPRHGSTFHPCNDRNAAAQVLEKIEDPYAFLKTLERIEETGGMTIYEWTWLVLTAPPRTLMIAVLLTINEGDYQLTMIEEKEVRRYQIGAAGMEGLEHWSGPVEVILAADYDALKAELVAVKSNCEIETQGKLDAEERIEAAVKEERESIARFVEDNLAGYAKSRAGIYIANAIRRFRSSKK